jgi:AcrR family transcriptional regulator
MPEAKEDKRQKIMDAVERLFTSRRFHEITLDQVAQKAGVGKGTIYLYFQDKDNLFFQTAISGFDELCGLLTRKVSDSAPFYDQLLNACIQIGTFFRSRKQLVRMIQNDENRMYWQKGNIRERWMEKRQKLIDALAQIIGRGVAEGKIRKDIPPDILAKFFLGMLRTRARDLTDAPKAMQQFDVVLNLFLFGASPQKEHGGEDEEG